MLRKDAGLEVTAIQGNTPQEFSDIPLLSDADKTVIFDPDNYMTRISYIYDPQRGQRHMDARLFLQGLYYTGAVLINKGLAYTQDPKVLSLTQENGLVTDYSQEPTSDGNRRQQLLAYYQTLEPYKNTQRSATSINPFHALFILKVALDHLPAHAIFKSAEKLIEDGWNMTYLPHAQTFPNGSCFPDDHAAQVILGQYVLSHPEKFAEFSSTRFMKRLKDMEDASAENRSFTLNPYSVLGGYPCEENEKKMMEMLILDPLNPPEAKALILESNKNAEDKQNPAEPEASPSKFSFFGTGLRHLFQLGYNNNDKQSDNSNKP